MEPEIRNLSMLSIIIPVLNEAETIEKSLRYLSENISGENSVEMIFVDGGSDDGTQKQILKFERLGLKDPSTVLGVTSMLRQTRNDIALGVILLHSERGRAKQMNLGAQNAKGEILYFLHADSFPPKDFDKLILEEVEKGNPAGCLRMKFDSSHWWLQLAGWFTKFNLKGFRGGDQSQFITKSLFDEIGGFDENYTVYEDNILIGELYKRKKFVVIPHSLTTSARRYREQGIWNLQYHFWMIHLKKRLGANANELYDYYAKHIETKNPKDL